jgi:hypothetical protein
MASARGAGGIPARWWRSSIAWTSQANHLKVPVAYASMLYMLRNHIDLMREGSRKHADKQRLNNIYSDAPPSGPARSSAGPHYFMTMGLGVLDVAAARGRARRGRTVRSMDVTQAFSTRAGARRQIPC